MKTLQLNNGTRMPAVGLGTWKSEPGQVYRAVLEAVRAGYRHIDCAWIYGNEKEIGNALKDLFDEGVVRRQDLWITSKLWNDSHAAMDVAPALRESLRDLQLEFLDLYLIHWPVAQRRGCVMPEGPEDMLSLADHPIEETWAAMEKCVEDGLCRTIGVSNFSRTKLEALLRAARLPPAVDQVEMHPYLQQAELLAFAREAGVAITAYSPLGSSDRPGVFRSEDDPVLLEDLEVVRIARERNATPAQVLLSWALRRGTAVVPKSTRPERIRQNLAATSVTLLSDDIAALNALDRHRRYLNGALWAMKGSSYTLENLWDEPAEWSSGR